MNSKPILHKAQAAGNDFIILPQDCPPPTPLQCRSLCCRRRGHGADGVIQFSLKTTCDLPLALMRYYNADGSRTGMCGNALRALTMHITRFCSLSCDTGIAITLNEKAFAKVERTAQSIPELFESDFIICKVMHITDDEKDPQFCHPFGEKTYWVESVFPLARKIPFANGAQAATSLIESHFEDYKNQGLDLQFRIHCADSGVDHLVIELISSSLELDLHHLELEKLSDQIKSHPEVKKDLPKSANVSFITEDPTSSDPMYKIRTFERGVFEETWSCTSAVVAAASFLVQSGKKMDFVFTLKKQLLQMTQKGKNLFLLGPAQSSYLTHQHFN